MRFLRRLSSKQFRTAYEGVSLDLRMFRPAEQDEALSRNELDVGFAMLPISNETFEPRTIARLKLFMAAPVRSLPGPDPSKRLANGAKTSERNALFGTNRNRKRSRHV
jgi:DNA-binding transcriptional LysR family regulator